MYVSCVCCFVCKPPPEANSTICVSMFVGWTQAINTLGMCANPSEQQLEAEAPTMQRPTRAIQNKFAGPQKNREVVKVTPAPQSSSPHPTTHTP